MRARGSRATTASCRLSIRSRNSAVGADAPDELEVDARARPGRARHDLAHDGLAARRSTQISDIRALSRDRELDEEVLLGGEVVEDRAAREADLAPPAARPSRPRSRARRSSVARPSRICSRRSVLRSLGDLRHRTDRTLQNRTDVLYYRGHGAAGADAREADAPSARSSSPRSISVLGTRMTYLALPWFVLVTTGSPSKMSLVLAAEILPMAILGVPSGALVQRLGSRTTMLVADFARAPILASIPLLYAAGDPPFLCCCSQSSRCSEPSRRRTSQRSGRSSPSSSARTRRACRRRTVRSRVEPPLPRCSARRSPARSYRSSAPRMSYTSMLRPISSRSASSSGSCLARKRAAAAAPARCARRRVRFLVSDKLLGPLAATITVFGFLAAGMSAGLPVLRVRRVRRELLDRRSLLCRTRRGRRRGQHLSPSSS